MLIFPSFSTFFQKNTKIPLSEKKLKFDASNSRIHIQKLNSLKTFKARSKMSYSNATTTPMPFFMKALVNLAKENQVSNKDFKAKMSRKASRVKQLQLERKLADKMDKELTKLEKIADKEQSKQAKANAKQAKEDAKQAKLQAKADAKQAKEDAKQAKLQAKQAKENAKQAKTEAKQTKVADKVTNPDTTKKSKLKIKVKSTANQENSREDIIQTICEQLGHGNNTTITA